MGDVDVEGAVGGGGEPEGAAASVRRIPSEAEFLREATGDRHGNADPYKALERSQSDAELLRGGNVFDFLDPEVSARLSGDGGSCSSLTNVSECTRVYMDLSKAEAYEKVHLGDSSASVLVRASSGRLLEPIPQDEELQTGDLSHVYASQRSFSNDSSSSLEDFSCSRVVSKEVSSSTSVKYTATGSTSKVVSTSSCSKQMEVALKSKSNLKSSFQIYAQSLKQKIRQLQMGSIPEQLSALEEMGVLMDQAWSTPAHGRDLAYALCDILQSEHGLDIVVTNCASSNYELKKASAHVLEQTLTTGNRKCVAEHGLETVVRMTVDTKNDPEMARTATGILESLFKTSEETCAQVIQLGGLDVILYWCRSNDHLTLRHCAIALANLALYGGRENQQEMTKHRVPEWLFPLAFSEDDSVRYYACLAISVLVANKEIENQVLNSGTLDLVLPFVENHRPAEFAAMDHSHRHGRSRGWLQRLVPLLCSKREEAQALAAFHFAMEAGIKAEQEKKEVLYEIGCVEPLRRLASSPNCTASRLAGEALKILGEELPHKLSQQVPLWTTEDVVHWVTQIGFEDFAAQFEACRVDGDLLLRISEDELRESIGMNCALTIKRFLRELRDLKMSADYTSCDPSKLEAWLMDASPELGQYTYQMVTAGVDRKLVSSLCDDHLLEDCQITNGIHRLRILKKITDGPVDAKDSPDGPKTDRPIDVFISYRRSNGSQLASLLKVHLQLRGFSVFLDIERLKAGKFDEGLLMSVHMAKNFILVLTPHALDRCIDDGECKDWVHKEVVTALDSGCNVIPLMDNFDWPVSEKLPEDMRQIAFFNGIRWIHDYQDACVDKLEQFIRGENNNTRRRGNLHQMGSSFERANILKNTYQGYPRESSSCNNIDELGSDAAESFS